MTIEDVIKTIERETGQKVNESAPLEELNVDSLEFLDLLIVLGVSSENSETYQTVGDLIRAVA